MPARKNAFKAALQGDSPLIGCWLAMAEPYLAELSAHAGFDWVVVDGEHAPNDIRSIRDQLMVTDPSPSEAVVRLPMGEDWLIKMALDIGVQTLLIPMVDSVEEAEALVRACRYPPDGIRGMGSSLARASSFGAVSDYVPTANDEICLLVQIESVKGLKALEDIASVDGVDGVFIGPADLGADMGFPGQGNSDEVWDTVCDALVRIRATGKAAGVLAMNDARTEQCLEAGVDFLAVAADISLFSGAMRNSAKTALARLPDQSAHGKAETGSGSKYLQQLCKHWSQKAKAEFDEAEGHVTFDNGNKLSMIAADTHLEITASVGPRGDLDQWKKVIEAHLKRFAFREDFALNWES